MRLWETFSQEAIKHEQLFDPLEISLAGDIIKEFNDIDPTGQVFRYPEDIKGNAHLTGLKLINVGVLREAMNCLHELLRRWQYQFEDQ
jgi:hypothetical protein